jgi:hypothetical protein
MNVLEFIQKQRKSKSDQLDLAIQMLYRQYPIWPSTFSECSSESCYGSARGGGYCAKCIEKVIAEISGYPDMAFLLHKEIQSSAASSIWIIESASKRKKKSE